MRTLVLLCCLMVGANAYAASGYHVIDRFELGGAGGWDYLTVDSAARRLYVSRSAHVMVADLNSGRRIADISGLSGVHGVALAPELNRGFVSNGVADSVTIFDLKSLKVLGHVRTGHDPDAILYDALSRRVFVFNGRSKDATIFDAASGNILATLPLGGKPEFATTDNQGRIYVNIEDKNEVVEIDSPKAIVLRRLALKPCEEPTGMGIDPERGRIFAGCRNRLMTILDVKKGAVVATAPIGEGVDGVAYDPVAGLAFSSNGDGTLSVVKEASPSKFETIETVATEKGARTMALDPATSKIYLSAKSSPSTATPAGAPDASPQPSVAEERFEILVVGP